MRYEPALGGRLEVAHRVLGELVVGHCRATGEIVVDLVAQRSAGALQRAGTGGVYAGPGADTNECTVRECAEERRGDVGPSGANEGAESPVEVGGELRAYTLVA